MLATPQDVNKLGERELIFETFGDDGRPIGSAVFARPPGDG